LAVGVTILVGVSTAFLITSDGARNFAPVLAFSSIYLIIRFGPLLSAKMIVVLATLSIVAQFAYLASGLNSFEPQYPTILDRVIALLQA
jgi:hypothetical protein